MVIFGATFFLDEKKQPKIKCLAENMGISAGKVDW